MIHAPVDGHIIQKSMIPGSGDAGTSQRILFGNMTTARSPYILIDGVPHLRDGVEWSRLHNVDPGWTRFPDGVGGEPDTRHTTPPYVFQLPGSRGKAQSGGAKGRGKKGLINCGPGRLPPNTTPTRFAIHSGMTLEFETSCAGFAPVYRDEPERVTASTNAGDSRLYVAGKGINEMFHKELRRKQGPEANLRDSFALLHTRLLEASTSAGSSVDAADVPGVSSLMDELHLQASFGHSGTRIDGDIEGLEGCNGSTFLHIFNEEGRPRHSRNAAMLYVVGPKGEGCRAPKTEDCGPHFARAKFLRIVESLGRQAMEMLASYNLTRTAGKTPTGARLPPIEELRWCLVSGGAYKHPKVTKVEVAKTTLRGMLSTSCQDLKITFTYDDDCFLQAFAELHPDQMAVPDEPLVAELPTIALDQSPPEATQEYDGGIIRNTEDPNTDPPLTPSSSVEDTQAYPVNMTGHLHDVSPVHGSGRREPWFFPRYNPGFVHDPGMRGGKAAWGDMLVSPVEQQDLEEAMAASLASYGARGVKAEEVADVRQPQVTHQPAKIRTHDQFAKDWQTRLQDEDFVGGMARAMEDSLPQPPCSAASSEQLGDYENIALGKAMSLSEVTENRSASSHNANPGSGEAINSQGWDPELVERIDVAQASLRDVMRAAVVDDNARADLEAELRRQFDALCTDIITRGWVDTNRKFDFYSFGQNIGTRSAEAKLILGKFTVKPIDAKSLFIAGTFDRRLKHVDGRNPEQIEALWVRLDVRELGKLLIDLENSDDAEAGLYCNHGFHRSSGAAEILRKKFYPASPPPVHIDIGHQDNDRHRRNRQPGNPAGTHCQVDASRTATVPVRSSVSTMSNAILSGPIYTGVPCTEGRSEAATGKTGPLPKTHGDVPERGDEADLRDIPTPADVAEAEIQPVDLWESGAQEPYTLSISRQDGISKRLSKKLRHKDGWVNREDAWAPLGKITSKCCDGTLISREELISCIYHNPKKRFALGVGLGQEWVRANQGHSLDIINPVLVLSRVRADDPDLPPSVLHGTKHGYVESILRDGLYPGGYKGSTSRNDIHASEAIVGSGKGKNLKVGIRDKSTAVIRIDLPSSMQDGVIWYRSANNVYLTRGLIVDGSPNLPAKYIMGVALKSEANGRFIEQPSEKGGPGVQPRSINTSRNHHINPGTFGELSLDVADFQPLQPPGETTVGVVLIRKNPDGPGYDFLGTRRTDPSKPRRGWELPKGRTNERDKGNMRRTGLHHLGMETGISSTVRFIDGIGSYTYPMINQGLKKACFFVARPTDETALEFCGKRRNTSTERRWLNLEVLQLGDLQHRDQL